MNKNITHGMTKTETYKSWCSMKERCSNPGNNRWKSYGGKGIKVCEHWGKFENFLSDMGARPKGKTLDRIENDDDYCPENCKWSTPKEQSHNRTNTVYIEYHGVTLPLVKWSSITGIAGFVLRYRVDAGWSKFDTLNKPVRYRRKEPTC